MKILVTSGGTSEPIDSVRVITNQATGTLGKIIVETFLEAGHEVTLVTTPASKKPANHPDLKMEIVTSVDSLFNCLKNLVPQHDVIIHSMAVSDYKPVYMTDLREVKEAEHLEDLLEKSNQDKKISSKADTQVLFLKKTPKVIQYVKQWNPAITLVGFKLLVDVSKEELLKVARQSLKTNQADYILANDLTGISSNKHEAYLVDKNSETFVTSKEAIAKLILERVSHV